jgi:CTP-dependent riboflavin kinase
MGRANRGERDLGESKALPEDVKKIQEQVASPKQLERYRYVAELVRIFTAHGSLPAKGPIRYRVATGELEGRPYDISALATALSLPRTTIFRHLEEMKTEGTIRTERNGRRTLIYLTDDGWREIARYREDNNNG